jgi:hypothetical protein
MKAFLGKKNKKTKGQGDPFFALAIIVNRQTSTAATRRKEGRTKEKKKKKKSIFKNHSSVDRH